MSHEVLIVVFRGETQLHITREGHNMVAEKMTKLGFVKDDNSSQLKEVFKDNAHLKEIHIDIYYENPLVPTTAFMLLLRTLECNATVSNDGNRIILKKCDKYETNFMNVLCSKITECFIKVSENYSEFVLNIQNIYYKITVLK